MRLMLALCLGWLALGYGATPFEVVWNGPSAGCNSGNGLRNLTAYGILANAAQSFNGSTITLFYRIGDWPKLNASMNATACWSEHSPGCSWNPWGRIVASANGGVPQAANITAHTAQVARDIASMIPDAHFSGLLIIDWEAWRPLYAQNDDGLSAYREYSRRLVLADPAFPPGSKANASALAAEAQRRFDAGARAFFSATVRAIRAMRPAARIGFYSQGINSPASAGPAHNVALGWLWELVDVLCPSIYPRGGNASAEAARVQDDILGAIQAAGLAGDRRPAVMPYARALIAGDGDANSDTIGWAPQPFDSATLATQVQIAAGLGADGVIMWGASADYHNNGCATIEAELQTFAGPTILRCIRDREACAAAHCHGRGRCVDYAASRLEQTCQGTTLINGAVPACRCDVGFGGNACERAVHVLH